MSAADLPILVVAILIGVVALACACASLVGLRDAWREYRDLDR